MTTLPLSIPSSYQLTRVPALTLLSDKTNTTQLSSSDKSGVLTRTIIDQGDIEETAVASTINAKEIMFNGKSLLDEQLDKEKLFETISSEYNLNDEQIIQAKAILNSKEWYDKTTTMSQLGSIIVSAIATVCTAGAGTAFVDIRCQVMLMLLFFAKKSSPFPFTRGTKQSIFYGLLPTAQARGRKDFFCITSLTLNTILQIKTKIQNMI